MDKKTLDINLMTRKDFEALPSRKFGKNVNFSSMVILPGNAKDIHDSGYRIMDFVACDSSKAICRLSGCSDVIHVDGIGGFGKDWLLKVGSKVPTLAPLSGWIIDCLPKSGLMRIWSTLGKMTCGQAISSFEIYALPSKEEL